MLCYDVCDEIISFFDIGTLFYTLTVSRDINRICKEKELYKQLSKFKEKTKESIFSKSIETGNLYMIKWLYYYRNINIHHKEERAFRVSCSEGHFEGLHEQSAMNSQRASAREAKWLYFTENIDIHAIDDEAFRHSCGKGHAKIAEWLYSLGNVDIHSRQDHAFYWTCEDGHLEVAKWLHLMGNISSYGYQQAFYWSCANGHFEIAKWLYSLDKIDLHAKIEDVFSTSCYYDRLEVVKWLYSLGNISIHVYHPNTKNYYTNVSKWLCSLNWNAEIK